MTDIQPLNGSFDEELDDDNFTMPGPTVGEVLTVGGTALMLLPTGDFITAGAAGLAGGAWLLVRRSPPFRRFVAAQLARMEQNSSPRMLKNVVRHLPVPPSGIQYLPEPARGSEMPAKTSSGWPYETIELEPQRPRRNGLVGFNELFGDDRPGTRPGRATQAPPARPLPSKFDPSRAAPQRDSVTRWVDKWTQEDADDVEVLSLEQLVDFLNSEETMEEAPHVLIVAPSRTGKTTLTQLLASLRPGKVLILDPKRPKGWEGPKWGGLPYVSKVKTPSEAPISDGYAAMVAALKEAVVEMDRRYEVQETATEPFQQLTVVLDEAKVSVEEAPELASLYRSIVSKGAEARVRLIVLSTTDRARKLGFDGEADSLESFCHIRLGEFATKVLPEVSALGPERWTWAVVRKSGKWVVFDNSTTTEVLKTVPLRLKRIWRTKHLNVQLPQAWLPRPAGETGETVARPVFQPATVKADERVEDPLLAELLKLAPNTVKQHPELVAGDKSQAGYSGEVRGEVSKGSARSSDGEVIGTLSATSQALPGGQSAKLVLRNLGVLSDTELLEQLKNIPTAERSKVLEVLQLTVRSGVSKTSAIKKIYGIEGGSRFADVAAWVGLYLEVKRRRNA